MEYAGAIALFAASCGVVVALVADKAVDDASPRLGLEVDADAADRADAEPKCPAVVSVEVAPVAQIGVIERRVVVRVQASYLVPPWLTSLLRFPVRCGLFVAVDYEQQEGADFQKAKTWRMTSWVTGGIGW